MASVVTALRHGGALSSPSKLNALLDIAKQNVAADNGFDLAEMVSTASTALGRPVNFYTLPVLDFRTLPDGEDVNIVDAEAIRSIVHSLVDSDNSSTPATTGNVGASSHRWANSEPTDHRVTLDVIDATGRKATAVAVRNALATGQLAEGAVNTAHTLRAASSIAYGAGAQSAAERLADNLGLRATASDVVAPDTVLLTIGTDFHSSDYIDGLASTSATTTSEAAIPTAVSATATGDEAPAPANLTQMTAGNVPCVR